MRLTNSLSLRNKLILTIMSVSLLTLLLAISVILYFEAAQVKHSMRQELMSLAQLIGNRSTAALTFNDPGLAQENLESLHERDDILSACLYRSNDELFAQYQSSEASTRCPIKTPVDVNTSVTAIYLLIQRPIRIGDNTVGSLYLRASAKPVETRLHNLMITSLFATFAALVVSFLLAGWLQRLIAGPITALSNTAATIEQRRDYTLRAQVEGHDEISRLARTFNTMLDTLEQQNSRVLASMENLKVSEKRFRSLVEQSPFSIQVLSPDGYTQQVNVAWEALWGAKLEDLANYNILHDQQLIDKQLMQYIERGFAGRATTIPPVNYNPALTVEVEGGKDISDRWVRAYIYPIKDESNQINEIILMHEDVTARKQSEDAIRNIAAGVSALTGEAFFQQFVLHLTKLFNAKYAFIGLLDAENPLLVNTLAVSCDGAVVDNLNYHLNDTPCANVVGESTCAYPDHVQQQFPKDVLLQKMGVESYLGTPLFDSSGKPIGLIVVLDTKPMTELNTVQPILEIFAARASAEIVRLKAEEQLDRYREHLEDLVETRTAELKAANKELETFSYSVSHDLRAPLRTINGFSQILLEDYQDKLDQEGKNSIQRIHAGAQRMGELIDDLLALSFISRQPIQVKQVDITNLAYESRMQIEDCNPSRSITWTIQDGLTDKCDARLLQVALDNLFSNACKYSSKIDNAHVEFATLVRDNVKVYYVRDNGAGFDMQHAGKLFGAFQRLHKTSEFPGSGIGLATVQRAIHRLGGCVWAESKPNLGATFYFTIGNDKPDMDVPE